MVAGFAACFAACFGAGVAARFGCGLAALRAEVLLEGLLEDLVRLRTGALAFLVRGARFGLAAGLEGAERVAFVAFVAGAPPFAALRTGAFFPVGRLASGFGRADFALNLRLFADDAGEALRVFGREAGLLTPLMIGSLMRSYSVIKMTHVGSQNAGSLT